MTKHEDPVENDEGFEEDIEDEVENTEKDEEDKNTEPDDDSGPEKPPPSSKKLPKRVLAYSSKELLQLFAVAEKSLVDGTFKSICKLWKQQFIWMLKIKGHWIPVVWGWLPDKTEVSYKVFFHMVMTRLQELGINFNLKEVIADFELNIHKAIDDILNIDILGCFFHLARAIMTKVDKKQMRKRYEDDPEFQKFVKEAVAIGHLPPELLETGFQHLKNDFSFDDETAKTFKEELLNYIETYWINGCYPPRAWMTFFRGEDWTNNNQEGFNSRESRKLKQINPSPGILFLFIYKELKAADMKSLKVTVGKPRPRKQNKQKNKVQMRQKMKRSLKEDLQKEGVNKEKLVKEFMAVMSHNIVSSTMSGRKQCEAYKITLDETLRYLWSITISKK